jgi:hypothetical protein
VALDFPIRQILGVGRSDVAKQFNKSLFYDEIVIRAHGITARNLLSSVVP